MTEQVGKSHGRVRVLFVAGSGRSGSTLLDCILGQFEGFFSAGEIEGIWQKGVLERGSCGCGTPVVACTVWRGIFQRAFGELSDADASGLVAARRHLTPASSPLLLTRAGRARVLGRLGTYPDKLARLYESIRDATGCRIVVDSSKDPLHAFVLSSLPSIDLSIVHLVRDPRGVAFSWQRKKSQPGYATPAFLPQVSPWRTAVMWDWFNLVTEGLGHARPDRILRVRYEDLMSSPPEVLERIGRLVGEHLDTEAVVADHMVRLDPTHSAWGNPSRFRTGQVALRADQEWSSKMALGQRAIVTAIALPMLRRYGYQRQTRYPLAPQT